MMYRLDLVIGLLGTTQCSYMNDISIMVEIQGTHILIPHYFDKSQIMIPSYQIFLVEQADQWPFNRAALMNVGAVEAKRLGNFSCFVFHDVDMLPEDDRALYKCPEEKVLPI